MYVSEVFGFSLMWRTSCWTFIGNPVCGACRATSRIAGIVRSGHPLPRQEQVVVDALRQTAGLLSDLAEEGQLEADKRESLYQQSKGENTGRSPGPLPPPKEVKSKEESEYTYETTEEEEAAPVKSEKKTPKDVRELSGQAKPPEAAHPPRGHKSPSSGKQAPRKGSD